MESKRICGYVRVSTDNQLENYSIDEQSERIKAYCKAKGWNLIKIYTDGGYSGGNTNRPALQQMISDLENNLVDIIVVYKLDRLSRSQKDTLMLIEDWFIAKNVDFISINENFDTSTPFGRAMIGILSVFAQLEKDQITERFTMGRIGRAKNGLYHGGGTAPTGYNYVDGNLIINEHEAIQVKEVFNRFLEGQSINAIQRHMSQSYTNQHGSWASHTLVLNVLKNDVYIGNVKFKKESYKGKHEPIITLEVFHKVQKLLTNQSRYDRNPITKTPFRANHILSSIVYCKRCGARYFGNHGKYSCYSRAKTNRDKILDPNCMNNHWKTEELDSKILDAVSELSINRDFLKNLSKKSDDNEMLHKNLIMKCMNDIDKQISRMIDLYQIGTIPIEQINERITKLKEEKDSLSNQLQEEKNTKLTIEEANELLDRVNYIFEHGDIPQKRLLISSLIEYIEVDGDNIDIYWSFI